mmetsp:Transcript_62379/g.201164  ORF Transcript_62379/g.201164 Transcript_62379/m.201164 type:complete len:200 (-) Transcript_62379:316-915(-)
MAHRAQGGHLCLGLRALRRRLGPAPLPHGLGPREHPGALPAAPGGGGRLRACALELGPAAARAGAPLPAHGARARGRAGGLPRLGPGAARGRGARARAPADPGARRVRQVHRGPRGDGLSGLARRARRPQPGHLLRRLEVRPAQLHGPRRERHRAPARGGARAHPEAAHGVGAALRREGQSRSPEGILAGPASIPAVGA